MFIKVHHVGYLVDDLDAAVEWYGKAFGGKHVGEGATALGRIAFVQMNDVEVELIEPLDKSEVAGSSDLVFHHVGYVVDDLDAAVADFKARGYEFATPEPFTNFAGYRLIYFDASSTRGTRMHLTEASSLTRN